MTYYLIIEILCEELDIIISELIVGKEQNEKDKFCSNFYSIP